MKTMETMSGYLLEKKKIRYQNGEIEVIKVVDYVVALMFYNAKKEWVYSIVSGDYVGKYVYDDEDYDIYEGLYISGVEDIEDVVDKNDGTVDFSQIRKDKLSSRVPFCYVTTNVTGDSQIIPISNKNFIDFLEKSWDSDEEAVDSYAHSPKTIGTKD